jgi:hypothetical protein
MDLGHPELDPTLEELVDELADALELLLDTSGCADMGPLWWQATRDARDQWMRPSTPANLALSPRLRAMSKSSRSKYRVLAAWRFGVLLEQVQPSVDAQAKAVSAIYFTPYDRNEPPYSWSSRVGSSPAAFSTPSELKELSADGCWDLVCQLRSRVLELHEELERVTWRRAEIIEAGLRRTLRDVLKLEDRWESWAEYGEADA